MNDESKKNRIDELVQRLNEASRAYYTDGTEIITNYEYDEMYHERRVPECRPHRG